jgi:hypothetical protein
VRGTSDITGDAAYKAKWTDLLTLTYPDLSLIALAFLFLLLAAAAQIYIPKFTGSILDALTKAFSGDADNSKIPNIGGSGLCFQRHSDWSWHQFCVESFLVSRGSIFTVVGGRVNVTSPNSIDGFSFGTRYWVF